MIKCWVSKLQCTIYLNSSIVVIESLKYNNIIDIIKNM